MSLAIIDNIDTILDQINVPIILWKYLPNNTITCVYTNLLEREINIGDLPSEDKHNLYMNVIKNDSTIEIKKNGKTIVISHNSKNKLIIETHVPSRDSLEILYSLNNKTRIPLTNIVGIMSMLNEFDVSPKVQKLYDIIEASSYNIAKTVNDLVDIINLEKGSHVCKNNKYNSDELWNMLETGFESMTEDIELDITAGEHVPKTICTDGDIITQILVNLIENFDVIHADKISLKITKINANQNLDCPFNLNLSAEHLLFQVNTNANADNDTMAILNNLLEINMKKNRITNHRNYGLGIFIAKRLIKSMGGKLWFRSTPDGNICYYFNILCKK